MTETRTQRRERRRTRWWAVATVATLAVLAGSLAPDSTAGSLPPGADKLLHAAGYAAIAFAVAGARRARGVRALAVVVVAGTALGVGVELVQPTVGRTTSLLDALANFAGSLLGVLAFRFSRTR